MREFCFFLVFGLLGWANCSQGCRSEEFACAVGGCISASKKCDYISDCSDGSDEHDCVYPCKSAHMQQCKNGHCVSTHFFCDGENDCGDWSDEFNCTRSVASNTGDSTPCPTNTFQCKGHMCIPQSWVCDGADDCLDGLDEQQCGKTGECKNGFKCGSECILRQWVCDGEQDCADGADEKDCGPDAQYHHNCLPEHGWFSCLARGVNKCIPIRRACDNFSDCEDHSDEGGLCGTDPCTNSTCSYGCSPTPKGAVCSCPVGYQIDGSNCVDIDECQLYPPMCSQNCINLKGGFQCSCTLGYTLSSDNRTCIANGPEPVLYITTAREIRSLSLRSKDYMLVRSGVSQAHSIAADFDDRFIYWAEKSNDNAGIYKSTLDGGAYDTIVSLGIEVVEDLDVDWVGRNVYFTDSGRKLIAVCDLHGTTCTVIISDGLDKPRGIAVHPQSRLLFWTDWGSHPHIGSTGMDGTERKEIITTEIVWPNSVAIDDSLNRIYWSDAKLNRIESCKLDGSDRKVLQAAVNHPHAIDVFESMVFWADPVDHEVFSCNKFTGKNQQIIMKESSLTPTGLYVHHPSKQRQMLNPCWHVVCSHLCLLSPSTNGFKCACPVGMILNSDNRTCSEVAPQSAMVIASYAEMFQITHQQIGRDQIIHLPIRSNIENIGALVYNPLGHSIVYSDLNRRSIYSMHMETYRETVLYEDVGVIEGLDVDPFTENMYWTEVSQGLLVVNSHDGSSRVILARGLHSPTCVTLAPERGLMFVVEGRVSHVISVWRMDGSWHEELVQVHGMVSSMSFDRYHLYYSDSVRGTIERVGIDGKDKTVLRSHLGSPMAVRVTSDSIFWLTRYSNRISWIKKRDLKTTRGFNIDSSYDSEVQYRKLAIIEKYDYSPEHACNVHSGGCSHICAPTPDGSKCLCPLGMELDDTHYICRPVTCRGDQWFKCNETCIPLKHRCDDIVDCPSGEDEKNCVNPTAPLGCSDSQFECHSGGCISAAYVCDGEYDCHDQSDEPSTCPLPNCAKDEFLCANNRSCIPMGAYCDGQRDCADGSDEANCTLACSPSQFYCKQSRLCIPNLWVCDADKDCEHGEDESNCSGPLSCPANYIRCPSHTECIPRITLCNGADDCVHATNEQLCASLNATHQTIADVTCAPDQFSCYLGSSECIHISKKCDCDFDCLFGEDEEGCSSCQHAGLFRCPGELKFINTTWICDGLPDCSNGADELPALCPVKTPSFISGSWDVPACPDSQFQCKSGHCIDLTYVCDGHPDCPDGTDEGRNCSKSCQNNGRCPHQCISTPEAPICQCNGGYDSIDDGRKCVDLDECTLDESCSQLCTNTKGSYHCSCAEGYSLELDRRTCKVLEGKPLFIVSSSNHVDMVTDDGQETRQLLFSDVTIKDISYLNEQSTVSWVTAQGLYKMNTLTSTSVMIYNLSQVTPTGLALDRYSGNYFVTVVISAVPGMERSAVRVISPKLSAEKTLAEAKTIYTDIVLDSSVGLMFWSEYNRPHSGRILRSPLDGSNIQWLHPIEKIVYPISITLDTVKRRIYWADMRLYSISSCDYNGNGQRAIVSNTYGTPLSVAFFENRVIWSNNDQKQMRIFDMNSQMTNSIDMERVHHISVAHSVLEPKLSSSRPCGGDECGNGLCLPKNSTAFSCVCPTSSVVANVNPFRCILSPDESSNISPIIETPGSPGVTVASILICLAILTILAVLGWVYYRRWRRTIGSPLKFRFRNALGLTEESTAWEDSVDYSDRKMLYPKSEDDGEPHIVVDQNENLRNPLVVPSQSRQPDSAYASQQSLVKSTSTGEIQDQSQPQLLPVSYSMKDQLLASEL